MGLKKFCLVLSASCVLTLALDSWADDSVTTGVSTEVSKKNTLQKIREKTQLLYWSMLFGPGFNSKPNQTLNGDGEATQGGLFHMLWTGYKLNDRDAIGVLSRFSQDFKTVENGEVLNGTFEMRDPRLYWRRSNWIDNSILNYTHEARVEIPTTARAREEQRNTVLQSVHIFNFKPKNKNLSIGIFNAVTHTWNKDDSSFLNFATGPYATYTLNPKWSIYAWTWFDVDHRLTSPFGSFDYADADYLRIGPMYSPVPNVQLYPCVQVYTFNPQWNTSTVGFELSAQL